MHFFRRSVLIFACLATLVSGWALFAPTRWMSGCGVAGRNTKVTRVERAHATLRTVVVDAKTKRRWEQTWLIETVNENASVRLGARVALVKSIFGFEFTVQRRELLVEIPWGGDLRGAKNGFGYEAQWVREG